MTSTDFSLINDSPSDAPNRRAPEVRQKPSQQSAIRNQQETGKDKKSKNQSSSHPDSVDQDERQFILLLLNRDPYSWRDFVSRYDKLIVSRILSTCREYGTAPRPDLVEDCSAEVMATLFRGDLNSLRQFQGRSKLSTWLAVIVRRTTLNFLHRHQRDTENIRPNDSQFDISTVPEKPRKDVVASNADDHAQIQSCMNRLNQSDRRALELYFDQSLSYAEIGCVLGITENAVGPKLHRAQKRLKKLMKEVKKST